MSTTHPVSLACFALRNNVSQIEIKKALVHIAFPTAGTVAGLDIKTQDQLIWT